MALERLLDSTGFDGPPAALYESLRLPEPPAHRPAVFINMVATLDGKTLIGPRGTTAAGLGSPTDQRLMRVLQRSADAAIIGAGTLRPGNVVYEPRMWRATFTRSGNLALGNRFFTDAPDRAVVFAPESLPEEARTRLQGAARLHLTSGESVDPAEALRILRQEYGVRVAALEGGANLNFEFLRAGLVDDIFLSVAPRVKGGASLPTVVDGPGFPDAEFAAAELLSVYRDASELYLRYRIARREG